MHHSRPKGPRCCCLLPRRRPRRNGGDAGERETVREAVLPDEGAGRRVQCVQGTRTAAGGCVAAHVQSCAVERCGRNVTGSIRRIAPAVSDRGSRPVPMPGAAPERVKDTVLVDRTDKGLRVAADDTGEQCRCRSEVAVEELLRRRDRPRADRLRSDAFTSTMAGASGSVLSQSPLLPV